MPLPNPVVSTFLVPSFRHHWIKPLPYLPLTASAWGPVPIGPEDIHISNIWYPFLLFLVIPPHPLLWLPVSLCILVVCTCSWRPFMCWREELAPPIPGDRPPHPSSPQYSAMPTPLIPPPPPPRPLPYLPCTIDTIPVSWYWWGAVLERNHTFFCHCRGCSDWKTKGLTNLLSLRVTWFIICRPPDTYTFLFSDFNSDDSSHMKYWMVVSS